MKSKRITIFAHWDAEGIIGDHVIYYLQELKKISDIIFVSDGYLSVEEEKKLSNIVIKKIAEPHGEYDFGSYKRGYNHLLDLSDHNYCELIFANDSCYGPFYPIIEVFDAMESREVEFWGIFEYYMKSKKFKHLQSFFLVFKRSVYTSEVFANFINSVARQQEKLDVVRKYEIGLTQTLRSAGFRYSSYIKFNKKNITYDIEAFDIIYQQRMPFLKRRILLENPMRCPKLIKHVYELFKQEQFASINEVIRSDLKRQDCSYRDTWHLPKPIRIRLFHRKIFSVEEKIYVKKEHSIIRVVLLGIRIIKMRGRRNVYYKLL